MEEIYIVKLKGLPPPQLGSSQESLSKDSKTSFYYHTDLTAEAIRGFSFLHIFFGFTVLCLSVTNLCFHESPLSLEPPLGITVWCSVAFILLGLFGMITAYKRKSDLSRSIFYVKIHFSIIVVVLSMTLTFIILFAFDLHGPIANQFIGLNIFFSIIVETVILLLTLFTCARVLWPGCMNFCAKDWPMQPKLKRKVIVKTNVFASGIQQDEPGTIQSVGPNCVISLNMPPLSPEHHHHHHHSPPPSSCTSSAAATPTKETPPSFYSPTPELTNSSTSLCSVSAAQTVLNQELSQTLSSQSIYHSSIGLANSCPLPSGNSMQTFPNDPHNRNVHSNIYGQVNRLLYQQTNFLRKRSFEDETISIRERNGQTVRAEEVDPYDTDEFDYCSTEDEDDHVNARSEAGDCHPSSSDEGNGTLEDDNKSSANSEQLSASHSETDLNKAESHFSENNQDLKTQTQMFEKTNAVIKHDSFRHLPAQTSEHSSKTVGKTDKNSLAEVPVALVEGLSYRDDEAEEDDHDEGISSSGSSTCSGELSQSSAAPFATRRSQTFRHKQTNNFKSSIKIESSSSAHLSLPISSVSADNTVGGHSLKGDIHSSAAGIAVSDAAKADSTTTIRLLTTKSSTTQPKQKLQIDLSPFDKESRTVPTSNMGTSKLASHPYLSRLRASNVDCFERRYPKYMTNPPLLSPAQTPSAQTDARTHNLSIKYQESNRIPDIQRV